MAALREAHLRCLPAICKLGKGDWDAGMQLVFAAKVQIGIRCKVLLSFRHFATIYVLARQKNRHIVTGWPVDTDLRFDIYSGHCEIYHYFLEVCAYE